MIFLTVLLIVSNLIHLLIHRSIIIDMRDTLNMLEINHARIRRVIYVVKNNNSEILIKRDIINALAGVEDEYLD